MFAVNASVIVRAAALVVLGLSPARLVAQDGDGYFFHPPAGSLSLHAGVARPSAASDVFAFTSQHLTLDRGSFTSASFSVDAGLAIGRHFEVLLGTGIASRTAHSNYRDFVDTDDQEIEQTTLFRRVPLMIGARFYLLPTGRQLGTYAWVPAKFAPYVSAGGGGVFYEFSQDGDFVDYETLDVFNAKLQSKGWTPSAYGAAGVTWTVAPRAALVTEARYDVAHAQMSRSFQGFERIDLSGASLTAGILFRF